jgi:hypothetical protein
LADASCADVAQGIEPEDALEHRAKQIGDGVAPVDMRLLVRDNQHLL